MYFRSEAHKHAIGSRHPTADSSGAAPGRIWHRPCWFSWLMLYQGHSPQELGIYTGTSSREVALNTIPRWFVDLNPGKTHEFPEFSQNLLVVGKCGAFCRAGRRNNSRNRRC